MSMWDPILDISDSPEPKGPVNPPHEFGIEEFKSAYRKCEQYPYDMRAFGNDAAIFERNQVTGEFFHLGVNSCFLAWRAACERASSIALSATGVPKDAKDPVRDHIVILGEEISEAILK